MRTIVSAEEMRWCDRTAIRSFGIPSILLMENAGRGSADALARFYGPLRDRQIVIVCGKGNNGGDGFVLARHLLNQGAVVAVFVTARRRELKGDALRTFDILSAIHKQTSDRLSITQASAQSLSRVRPALVVDALLGTGFSGTLRPPLTTIVDWMNRQSVPVVSLDIPSGVNGTTGTMANKAVRATRTFTMGAVKTGLLCNSGAELSGTIETVDIGIPLDVYHSKRLQTFQMTASDVRLRLPRRERTAHKYGVGKIFVIAGSRGFTGAAALTAQAALRAGAGAVVLGTPESVYPILAKKLSEAIVIPLPATQAGSLSPDGLEVIEERIKWADVTVIGPGLSQNRETMKLVIKIVSDIRGKILLDADGLNAVASAGIRVLKKSKSEITITPHVGEFSRLSKIASADVEAQRIDHARGFSRDTRTTLVLKGAPTVTADAAGTAILNSTGNPGMATVGSGDVLSGIIAALWAQGMGQTQAAATGVWIHGKSGDLAADALGERSIVAQDLIDSLPHALQSVAGPA